MVINGCMDEHQALYHDALFDDNALEVYLDVGEECGWKRPELAAKMQRRRYLEKAGVSTFPVPPADLRRAWLFVDKGVTYGRQAMQNADIFLNMMLESIPGAQWLIDLEEGRRVNDPVYAWPDSRWPTKSLMPPSRWSEPWSRRMTQWKQHDIITGVLVIHVHSSSMPFGVLTFGVAKIHAAPHSDWGWGGVVDVPGFGVCTVYAQIREFQKHNKARRAMTVLTIFDVTG